MFAYTGIYHLVMLDYGIYFRKWIPKKDCLFSLMIVSVQCNQQILLQTTESVHIYNVTLIDNGMAIFSMIYMPSAVSHKISSKTVQIKVNTQSRKNNSEKGKIIEHNDFLWLLCLLVIPPAFVPIVSARNLSILPLPAPSLISSCLSPNTNLGHKGLIFTHTMKSPEPALGSFDTLSSCCYCSLHKFLS